jgi:GNAT superfamily N-acetyltransferase
MEVLTLKDDKFKIEEYSSNVYYIGENDAFIRFQPHDIDTMELIQIFVSSEARRVGFGTRIIKKFEEIVRERGKTKIIAYSGATPNEVFGKFIIKMGYTNLEPGIVWGKTL